ncbi:MAG: hypothetical protein M1814_005754 [Vezdaea aestivalis]|nr:MAG: hypothetical protein M1814_005754 [Vezdaea aestivalis]
MTDSHAQTRPIATHTEPAKVVAPNHAIVAAKDVAFGSTAGMIGKLIEYPFDTVKVRLQSQPDGLPLRYTGPLDCLQQSIRQHGFIGIYRGVSAPLLGAALETSSLFCTYGLAQRWLKKSVYGDHGNLPIDALLLSGALSGATTSLVLTPVELVKCKIQVPSEALVSQNRSTKPMATIASIYRQEGLLGFWHGQLGTLLRETGGSMAWFGLYEVVSAYFRSRQETPSNGLPVWQQMLAGASGGMGYNFVFYPADTIKSRMQTEESAVQGQSKKRFLAVGKSLWNQHGIKGLYRGCGITVLRSMPSSAVMFVVYEALKQRFN